MKKTALELKAIKEASLVLKSIAHPVRLRVIEALDLGGEMTVSQLLEKIPVTQAELSKQLALLKSRGILRSAVDRNYRLYSIAFPGVINVLDCIRKHHSKGD